MKKNLELQLLAIFFAIFAGCSPKVVKVASAPKSEKPVKVTAIETPVKRFTEAQVSLIIPFKLNQLNLGTVTKAQVDKTEMAIDFYQGVLLGIDSAAAHGLNFKVNVLDGRDETTQLSSLLRREDLKKSNLIIGPVFPEGLKYMTNFAITNDLPVVSPLAASKPSDFNNPKLISIVNNIDQHGEKIADYIADHFLSNASIVVLINPKKTADEQFATPIKNRFRQKYPSFIVQEYVSAAAFETRMIKGKQYAVIICSSEVAFVKPTLSKLYKLSILPTGGYDIDLFGHPNWSKQNYNVNQLQALHTVISSSYHINYSTAAVVNFVRKYRAKYNFEPSEYSFKGFDIGFYFGRLLARYGANYLDHLTKETYKGLHNSFEFAYHPKSGYFNTELMLLQYKNLNLNVIN
jgi:ABC-type branched-subunit amino acid transport system substrate-binding protein